MRKIALKSVSGAEKPARRLRVTPDALREYLGAERHRPDDELPVPGCGVAVGLAWTEVGGDMLKIEVTVLDGKGELTLTGQLGDVMQESARAAMTYVRSRLRQLGLPRTFFAKHDVHIHVPEGAIPKDGPSAGITLAAALYSALGNKPVRERLAMTGEITLRGSVLQVGGLKEKLLAAHRAGVRTVLIPARNAADLDDIPPDVRSALDIRLVTTMDEVAAEAFGGKGPRRGAR